MNLTDLFVKRCIATTLVMAAILGFGILAYLKLPVSDLPSVDFPTISVSASLPGASPETMASSVATPLEKRFSAIPGIDSMTSSSTLGSSSITIQFDLSRDIDAAAQDVQAAVSQAQRDLPADLTAPPSFRKVNPADAPVLLLAATSDTLPLSKVDEYAETLIGQRLSTITGVAQVDVYGSQKFAVRVQVDPRQIAIRGIGLDIIENAIRDGNSNAATGQLDTGSKSRTIKTNGQLTTAPQYRKLIVAYRGGVPVRLDQVAHVTNSVEDDKNLAWFNQTRGVVLAVQRQPGANTVQVIDNIRKLLPTFQAQLPAGIRLDIVQDRSLAIRESLHDVQLTLVLAIVLVIFVIFVFLRNLRATFIPSTAIPLSIIGTFAVMYLLGFSMNNFSLMAVILAVGFVVDDAIVVLETIVRYIEQGDSPMEAALKGGREIGFTILSMTLSLAAVFIPVLFMGGILGRLLNEFAVTIAVAILLSGFISLSLTPMLCSRFLKAHVADGATGEKDHGRLYNWTEQLFGRVVSGYENTLHWAFSHQLIVAVVAVVMAVATAWLFILVPKGFLPTEDTGRIQISTEAEQGISFDKMMALQSQASAIVAKNSYVAGYLSRIGGGSNGSNTGRFIITLKDRRARPPVDVIIKQMRKDFASIVGLKVFPQNPPVIRIGGAQTKSLYQFSLFGPDLSQLYGAAAKMETAMRKIPGLVDVTTDLQISSPQVLVSIDRDKAATLGINSAQIESTLGSAYGARQISTIFTPNDQYRVILELGDPYKRDAIDLDRLYVTSTTGKQIPLGASFDLNPGVSLGDVVPRIEKDARTLLDPQISTQFQGTAQAFTSSLSGLGFLLVASFLLIYIILGILYESFIHPITILSGLPSAGFGALLTLLIFKAELNVYGFVGLLMLIGIVKKNAIMMIDFALDAQRNGHKSPADAIFEACLVRFRPILMTTLAAMAGTLPIALGLGAGGAVRRPLGLAVVGGLVISQVVTLYITPLLYLYLENFQQRFSERKQSTTTKSGKRLSHPLATNPVT